jgi:hypothetical protein
VHPVCLFKPGVPHSVPASDISGDPDESIIA